MFIVRKKSVPEVVSENCYLLEAHLDHEDLHEKSKQINGQINNGYHFHGSLQIKTTCKTMNNN